LKRGHASSREVLHDLAAVEEVAVVEQVAVEAGRVRQTPGVGGLALHVEETVPPPGIGAKSV